MRGRGYSFVYVCVDMCGCFVGGDITYYAVCTNYYFAIEQILSSKDTELICVDHLGAGLGSCARNTYREPVDMGDQMLYSTIQDLYSL